MTQHRLLFVCTDDICRAPLAEGIARRLLAEEDRLDEFLLASTGRRQLAAGDLGEAGRMIAAEHGIDLTDLRIRPLDPLELPGFSLVLALDQAALEVVVAMAPDVCRHRVHRLLDFAPWMEVTSVPRIDAGDPDGLAAALDVIELGLRGLMEVADQSAAEWAVPQGERARVKVSSTT